MTRIEKLAKARPKGIILREKDMYEAEYLALASDVLAICKKYNTPCILHSFVDAAKALHHRAIHLPMHILRTLSDDDKSCFDIIGASCHSVEDAIEARTLGCTYITAGHIFNTDCKKGLDGRGLDFLKDVSDSVSIPVYAIGGISSDNIAKIRKSGAKGACVMSSAMICDDPTAFVDGFKE